MLKEQHSSSLYPEFYLFVCPEYSVVVVFSRNNSSKENNDTISRSSKIFIRINYSLGIRNMRVLGETLTVTQVRHKTNLLQRNELLSKKTKKVGPRFTRINKRHRVHEKKRRNILGFFPGSLC